MGFCKYFEAFYSEWLIKIADYKKKQMFSAVAIFGIFFNFFGIVYRYVKFYIIAFGLGVLTITKFRHNKKIM